MARTLLKIVAGAGVLGLAAVGAFVVAGPDRVWRIAGDPDQGSVDWDDLKRSPDPNDAFMASTGASASIPDVTLSLYDGSPQLLVERVDDLLRGGLLSGTVKRVDDGRDRLARRYVVRTPTMGFPDTLNVAAREVDGKAGLLLYSRALIGKGDLGANEKRLLRIVEGLRLKAIAT